MSIKYFYKEGLPDVPAIIRVIKLIDIIIGVERLLSGGDHIHIFVFCISNFFEIDCFYGL